MRFFTTFLILLLATTMLFAQNTTTSSFIPHGQEGHRCGFDEQRLKMEATYPELVKMRNEYLETVIPEILANQDRHRSQASITVPVVFHVIHNGESVGSGANIPDQVIFDQLQTLNQDFQALNGDFTSTPDRFKDAIGNPDIQFCLAQVDPNGNPTTGITRDQFSNTSDGNVTSSIKPSTSWDPTRYYNIWTLAIPGTSTSGGVTGYAYLPYQGTVGDPSTDGTVLDWRFTGADESTLTHETGHYLGLFHPWGDGGCGQDDGFPDTPVQSSPTSDSGFFSCGNGYPAGPETCGVEHMYVNYMDYAQDNCYTSFSAQQVAVMRAVLMGTTANPTSGPWASRNGLVQAAPTVAFTCAPTGGGGGGTTFQNDIGIVQIISPNGSACADEMLSPVVEIQNQFGENVLTTAKIQVKINGANEPLFTWNGNLAKSETAIVTLPPFLVPAGDFSLEVVGLNPNNQIDEWGLNDEQSTSITVNVPQLAPLLDDFETTVFGPTNSGLAVVNPDNDQFVWQYKEDLSAYGVGTGCSMFDNFSGNGSNNPNNTTDILVTPPLDMTVLSGNLELSFDLAYSPFLNGGVQFDDGLEILISTDCGASYTTQLYFKEGSDLQTTLLPYGIPFEPSPEEWRNEKIDLSPYQDLSSISIAFVNHSGYGNFLYVDNINIGTGCPANANISSATDISCFGACDGAIDLSISGFDDGYTVTWSDNAGASMNEESLTGLCAGDYSITVTDGEDCEIVRFVTLTEPDGFNVVPVVNGINEVGGMTGTIVLSIQGDLSVDYTFEWSDGLPPTSLQQGLGAGTYTVTITSENAPCPNILEIVIDEYDCSYFTGTVSNTDVSCNGDFNGISTVTAEDVTEFIPFNWYNDSGDVAGFAIMINSVASATNLLAGTYTVVGEDSKGCTIEETVVIGEPPVIDIDASISPETVMGAGDASITITPSGGAPDYEYSWSNNMTSNPLTGLVPATYTVTVTDNAGCTASQTITIDAVSCASYELNISATNIQCSGEANGTASVAIVGGQEPYEILWSNDSDTNGTDNLPSGLVSVAVVDALGCPEYAEIMITEPDAILVQLAAQDEQGVAQNNGSVTATISGGTGTYMVAWDNGMSGETIENLEPGTYFCTITDSNGCSTIQQTAIAAFSCGNYGVELTATDIACFGAETGTATAIAVAGTEPYNFAWNNNETTNTISDVSAGMYTVTVTDANGCSDIQSIEIGEATELLTQISSTTACFGEATGSATASLIGLEPIIYEWDNDMEGATITALAAGVYTVTATDANGCQMIEIIEVGQEDEILVSLEVNGESGENAADGSILPTTIGNGPFIYTWSTDAMTETIDGLAPGFYGLTVTDSNGCTTAVDEIEITVGNNPCSFLVSSAVQTDVSCFGAADGTIAISLENNEDFSYTYLWDNDATTPSLSNLNGGTYVVTISETASGCSAIETVTIAEPNEIMVQMDAEISCFGQMTGSAAIGIMNGVEPIEYEWNNDMTDALISAVSAGVYTVTATDATGCQVVGEIEVAETTELAVDVTVTGESGEGLNDGIIVATVTGEGPYNYEWNSSINNSETLDNLVPGVYSLTVTDANGCMVAVEEIAVTEYSDICASFGASVSQTGVSCFGGTDASIEVIAESGEEPYTFNWAHDATGSTLTNLAAGTYTVTIVDGLDCELVQTVNITEPEALVLEINGENETYITFGDGSATVVAEGGTAPYMYSWDNQMTVASIANLVPGTYEVVVTDANDCSQVANIEILEGVNPCAGFALDYESTNVTCNGEATGSISLILENGNEPFIYNWDNDATTDVLTELGAGMYTVVVSDEFSCTSEVTIEITEPSALDVSVSASDESLEDANDGAISVLVSGGTGVYTYAWNIEGDGPTQGDLEPGSYTVTISDENECQEVLEVEIAAGNNLCLGFAAEYNVEPVSCNGGADGQVSLSIIGGTAPFSYNWSNGTIESDELTGLEAGIYMVTIVDINSCDIMMEVEVTEPDALELDASVVNETVLGLNDGSITVTNTGGTMPYRYTWGHTTNGDSMLSNLEPGTYMLTVTDENDCVTMETFVISEGVDLCLGFSAELFTIDATCFEGMDASIEVGITGGTAPYSYTWSNDAIETATLTGIGAGMYSVTITDENSCDVILETMITEPEAMNVGFAIVDESLPNQADGSITAMPSGGTAPYTYLWADGTTEAVLENLSFGTYEVTVTDANDCLMIGSTTVSVNEPDCSNFDAGFIIEAVSCNGDADGSAEATPLGGIEPYNVVWSTGDTETMLSDASGGQYQVVITDAVNCTGEYTVTIPEPNALEVEVAAENGACGGAGAATALASGGTAPYQYLWETGETESKIFNLGDGSYTVTVTDANDCSMENEVVVATQENNVNFIMDAEPVTCYGGEDGMIVIEPIGGFPPFNYEWENGATDNMLEDLEPGSYTVFVTDATGCTFGLTEVITEPSPMLANISVDEIVNGYVASCSVVGGTAPYTYQWSDGSNTVFTEVSQEGEYYVTVTDANGCNTIVNSFVGTVSTDGIADLLTWDAFPNPTSQVLNIQVDMAQANDLTVQLFNIMGQVVYTQQSKVQSLSTQIDAHQLPTGTYVLRLSTAQGQVSKKVVVVR